MSDTIPSVTEGPSATDNPDRSPIERVRSIDRRLLIAVAVPMVVGIAVAAWNLGGKPLWYDETFEALLVMHPPLRFAYWVATFETSGAVYHGLLWFWKFLGTNEFALRLPSVVFAVLAIPVTFLIGRRFLSVPWAGVAGLLLGVSSLWLSHAQEARPYALYLLMAGLSTLALLRAVENPTRVRWAVYAIVTVLAIWTHLMIAFVVLAQVLAMALHPDVRRWFRPAAISVAVAALSAIPIIYSISHANQARWYWLLPPTAEGLWEGFRHLTSDSGFLLTLVWLAIWGAGIAIGSLRWWRNRKAGWPIVLVALISVLVILGPLLASYFKEMYTPRYILPSLPAMILLGTLTMSVLRPRVVGAALAGVLVATGLVNVYKWHDTLGWPDFRAAVQAVVNEGGPADGLAYFYRGPFEPGALYEYRYYLTQTANSEDRPTIVTLPATPEPLEQRIDSAIAGYQRLFFIGVPAVMNDAEGKAAIDEIERSFTLARDFDVTGLDVRLYTRTAP